MLQKQKLLPLIFMILLTLHSTHCHFSNRESQSNNHSKIRATSNFINQRILASCVCPDYCQPLCAKNGQTYCNSCFAKCAGTEEAHSGKCQSPNRYLSASPSPTPVSCICPLYCLPLCAKNGQTYCNQCLANCAGTEEAYPGQCLDCHKPCPQTYNPVCAENNLTYRNICFLVCRSHKKFKQNGACPQTLDSCFCISKGSPVCGADGNIYANACEAGCHSMSTLPLWYCDSTITNVAALAGVDLPSSEPNGLLMEISINPNSLQINP